MAANIRGSQSVGRLCAAGLLTWIIALAAVLHSAIASDGDTANVDQLIRGLTANTPAARAKAAASIRQMGAKALRAAPALVARLSDDDEGVARAAKAALISGIGSQCVPDVMKGLAAPAPRGRRLAAEILAAFGTRAKPAVPALLGVLNDRDASVRAAAANALGYAADSAAIEPLVLRTRQDPVADVRNKAAGAIQVFGPDATSAIPSLMHMLGDGSDTAAAALASIGDEAIPP